MNKFFANNAITKIIFMAIIICGTVFVYAEPCYALISAIVGAVAGAALVGAGILSVSIPLIGLTVSGALLGAAVGALAGAAYGSVAGMLWKVFTADTPEMPSVGTGSGTYGGQYPVVTVERGTPIPLARGKLRLAGNIVRVNDPEEADYYKMIVAHCQGQSDTTVPRKSGTTFLSYCINGAEWSTFTDPNHKFWSHSGATVHQSGVSNLFSTDVSNFRGITLTEFKLKKGTSDVQGVQNANVVGRFGRCLEIGQDLGGVKSWTRNPAQILWDWYIENEKYSASDLNQDAFEVLKDYCDYIPPNSESVPVWPPGPGNLTVRATSRYSDYANRQHEPFYAFDKDSPLIGTAASAAWVSAAGSPSNQRVNIDLGDTYVVNKFSIENYHSVGTTTDIGVATIQMQGSNIRGAFEDATFVGAAGWFGIALSTSSVTEHPATDTSEPQIITVASEVPYRYYSFIFTTNHGNASYMGVRRIKLYGKSPRYTFDYNFDTQIAINDAKKLIWKSFNGMCVMNQGKIKPVWDAAENCYNDGMLLTKEDSDFLLLETGDNILLERSQTKTVSHNFTIDNIVKDSFVWSKPRRPNIVRVHYINSQDSFKKDMVEVKDETDIDAKGELIYEETCWWITESDIARRRARFKFDKARYTDYICKLTGFPDSSPLDILDRVKVSHPSPVWSAKDFLVISKGEDNIGRPAFDMEAYYSGIYHDRGYEQQENYASKLPNPFGKMSGVTGIALTEDAFFDPSGNWINKVTLTYTPPQNPFYSHSRIWLKVGSVGDGVGYEAYGIDNSGGDNFIINNVKGKFDSGSTITMKVEAINQAGIGSGTCPAASIWVSLPDLAVEIAALIGDAKLTLPKGTYLLPESGVSFPAYNITIHGINRDGVIIQNSPTKQGFLIHNKKKRYEFNSFTIDSQNTTTSYSTMIYNYGTSVDANEADIILDNIMINLNDVGVVIGSGDGDRGIRNENSKGKMKILDCGINGGAIHVTYNNLKSISMQGNAFDNCIYCVVYSADVSRAVFSENEITDFWNWGFIQPSGAPDQIIVTSNTFKSKDDSIDGPTGSGVSHVVAISNLAPNAQIFGNTIKIKNTRSNNWLHSAIRNYYPDTDITGNSIEMDISSTSKAIGVCDLAGDSVISANTIKINASDNTEVHYGIYLGADRTIAEGNYINLVNNDANDIGIRVVANNCKGANLTYNVGTSVLDTGAGNDVTAKDI